MLTNRINSKILLCTLIGFVCTLCTSSNLSAQELTSYQNPFFGFMKYYQDDDNISKADVSLLMQNVPAAKEEWDMAGVYWTSSLVASGATFGYLIYVNASGNNTTASSIYEYTPFWVIMGLSATAITFDLLSRSSRNKALRTYNRSLDDANGFLDPNKQNWNLSIGQTGHGVGLTLSF